MTKAEQRVKFEVLRWQAMILYVKKGLNIKTICQQLEISQPVVTRWIKAGNWNELRPDFEILTEYKAASMFIDKGMSAKEISQHLNVSEVIVNMWIDINGWNAARQVSQAQNVTVDIVTDFCGYFKRTFNNLSAEIEVVQSTYTSNIISKRI